VKPVPTLEEFITDLRPLSSEFLRDRRHWVGQRRQMWAHEDGRVARWAEKFWDRYLEATDLILAERDEAEVHLWDALTEALGIRVIPDPGDRPVLDHPPHPERSD
jgi:hypothetical protein